MTEKIVEKAPAGIKRKKKKSIIGIDPLAWMNDADTVNGVTEEPISEVEQLEVSELLIETAGEIIETSQETPEQNMESTSAEEEEHDMDMQQADFGLNGKFKLEGPLTIADVAILHDKFKTSIDDGSEFEIDCTDVDGVDAAALQLLLACALELEKQDKKLTWKDPSDSMMSAVELMGLKKDFRL